MKEIYRLMISLLLAIIIAYTIFYLSLRIAIPFLTEEANKPYKTACKDFGGKFYPGIDRQCVKNSTLYLVICDSSHKCEVVK